MTSWMMPGGSFNEADEDEASDVSEQIKAVDLELQQLQFEMQLELANQKAKEAAKEKER